MNIRSHIPNLFTIANLICGSIACLFIAQQFDETLAVFLIFLAAFFDLLDGAVARLLRVSGELGKQLDSLADVVSFGLVPSIIIYQLLDYSLPESLNYLKYLSFINVACAALRLAKFNISKDQSHDFSGMPSPANGIFWASVLAIYAWQNSFGQVDQIVFVYPSYSVWLIMLFITSMLMVSGIRMFSFKFLPGGFRTNMFPYLFLAAVVVISFLSLVVWQNILLAIPLSILTYMIMSFAYHTTIKGRI